MRNTITVVLLGLAVVLAGCMGGGKGAGEAGKVVLRVNAGADKEYVDAAGNTWLPDQESTAGAKYGAVGGKVIRRTLTTIAGTQAPEVYLTERYSMTAYKFALPNGKYTVRLHFAETFEGVKAEGLRVFSVKVQGLPVLTDFDVFKTAGGFAKPAIQECKGIQVTDGTLAVEFIPKVQNPEINGIEIIAR